MAKIDGVQEIAITELVPYERNAKLHGEKQVDLIAKSISEFGFLSPCLIDKDKHIIAGHGRVMAAKKLGLEKVPFVYIEGLTEEQRRAYILADNRLTELGGWDMDIVNEELSQLRDAGFDIDVTGFEFEIDDEEQQEDKNDAYNPTLQLPESRLFVFAISAFGTNTERFIEIKLTQEEADHLLKRADEMQVSEIADRFREAINGL